VVDPEIRIGARGVVVSAGDLEIGTAVWAENQCWRIGLSDHVGANLAALHEGKMLTDLR